MYTYRELEVTAVAVPVADPEAACCMATTTATNNR